MNNLIRVVINDVTFEASDQDNTGLSYYYNGFLSQDGQWVIMRTDITVTNVMAYRYATRGNNPGTISYSTAWSGAAGLTYDLFSVAKI